MSGGEQVEELQGRRVLVYVSGSIAAVKSGEVVTLLRRRGAETRVVMTESATRFITPLALQSLSGNAVVTDLFRGGHGRGPGRRPGAVVDDSGSGHGMEHLDLSGWAELQLAVAASANLIARLALGLADDAVTATALACRVPLVIAPAMETAMWEHPATVEHVETLRGRGAVLVGPVSGRLASGREAMGRMADPAEIVRIAAELLGGLGQLPSGLLGTPDAGGR
jgi:phosphopantothenoylcysteine decarboxylase/phosphopantothenate--cysteine ligase